MPTVTLTRLTAGVYCTKDKRYRVTNTNHLGMPLGHWQVWNDRGQLVSEHPTLADARDAVGGHYTPSSVRDTPAPWHPVDNMTPADAAYVAKALPYLVARPYMREFVHYTRCQDCDALPGDKVPTRDHLVLNGVVVIGCEGYHQLRGHTGTP